MRFFFVILCVILVFTEAKSDCLNPEDILTEKVSDKLYAHPPKNHSSCGDGWIQSSIPLTDIQQVITIEDHQVSLCAKSGDSVESESIQITLGAIEPPCMVKGLNLVKHDSVMFSLLPSYEIEITKDICADNNSNIKVLDQDNCKKNFLGKKITSNIRPGKIPVESSNYTGSDCRLAGSNLNSNLVNLNKSKSAVSNWQDYPVLVIDKADKSSVAEILIDYKKTNQVSMSDKDLQSEFWGALCHGNTPTYTSADELKSKKIYINQMKNSIDSTVVNMMCENLCYVQYDTNGNISDSLTTDCLFTVAREKNSGGQYISYLPGTSGQDGSGKAFDVVGGNPFPKGIQLDYEYDLDNPKAKVDIVRGDKGVYNLKVFRGCSYRNKRSLYYYIGDSCPTVKPGDSGTHPIEMFREVKSAGISSTQYLNKKIFKTDPSWNEKKIYFGIRNSGNIGDHHSGFFKIHARIPKDQKAIFANVITKVLKYVNLILYGEEGNTSNVGAVRKIYNTLVYGPYFVNIIRSVLILYIAVYALLYIIGMVRSSQMDLIVILIKIGIIIMLISPQSWKFFDDNFFKLFTTGNIELINIMSFSGKDDTNFQFIDKSLARFAESQTWLQILAIIFTGPVGFICAFIIIWGVWTLFLAILRAIIIFFVSIVIIALLLCISPLFISFILFKRTRTVFDNWVKILIQTIMQPVMVFAAIVMLNEIMMNIIYVMLSYNICTQCFLKVDLGSSITEFCLMNAYLPANYLADNSYSDLMKQMYYTPNLFFGIPIRIQTIMSFIILCHAVSKFVEEVPNMVSTIFGAIAVELSAPAKGVEDTLRAVIGKDQSLQRAQAQQQYRSKISPSSSTETGARTKARQEIGK